MPTYNNALAAFLSQAQQSSNQLANPRRNLMQTQMMARPEQPFLRQQYPTTYGALAGLVGVDPNEMGGSVLDPNTAAVVWVFWVRLIWAIRQCLVQII